MSSPIELRLQSQREVPPAVTYICIVLFTLCYSESEHFHIRLFSSSFYSVHHNADVTDAKGSSSRMDTLLIVEVLANEDLTIVTLLETATK